MCSDEFALDQFGEDRVQWGRHCPCWIIPLKAAYVADVANVIAAPTLVEVLNVDSADRFLHLGNRLEHRSTVRAAAAQIVYRPGPRRFDEVLHRLDHIAAVQLVPHL